MKISLDLTKEYDLCMDSEELNLITSGIINRFNEAVSYYTLQIKKHPELKDLIKIEGD